MVLALKSGITFIRTRPEPLPRLSTATKTSAARLPLSCRLPRRPACSPPTHVSSTSISPCSGSRPASVRAKQTRHACRWSSDRRPKTNGSMGFWSHEEPSRQLARPDDGSRHTAAVDDSTIRTLADVHIGHKRSRRAIDRPPGTLGRLPRWRSRFETAVASWEMAVWAPLHATYWGMLSQPDKQKAAILLAHTILHRATP